MGVSSPAVKASGGDAGLANGVCGPRLRAELQRPCVPSAWRNHAMCPTAPLPAVQREKQMTGRQGA